MKFFRCLLIILSGLTGFMLGQNLPQQIEAKRNTRTTIPALRIVRPNLSPNTQEATARRKDTERPAEWGEKLSTTFAKDPYEAWMELQRLKGTIPDRMWKRLSDDLVELERPHMQSDFLEIMSRWEDNDGSRQLTILEEWKRDPSGRSVRKLVDSLPNPYALYALTVPANLGGDWLATAEYGANLSNLTPSQGAQLIDQVLQAWRDQEGVDVVSFWLKTHQAEQKFDLARQTAFLASGGTDQLLLQGMSSETARKKAELMAVLLKRP